MITMIVHLRVPPQNADAFEALMSDVCATVKAREPGVVHYSFARCAEDPQTYVVIEVYRDAAVHAAHMASDIVRESLPKTAALIEGRPQIRQYVSQGTAPVPLRTQPEQKGGQA